MKCPKCNGLGIITGMFPKYAEEFQGERKPYIEIKCNVCENGEYSGVYDKYLGESLRIKRLNEANLTLREFAKKYNMDIGKISTTEQGFILDSNFAKEYETNLLIEIATINK